MKKNVVFWIGVKNKKYSDKYGGWEWLDISKKTWQYWCDKNDVLFVPFETPIEEDLIKFRINWQKALFVFDELERLNIEYNQEFLVDGMNMIKWNAPNIFNLTENKFVGWRDIDNLNWVYQSKIGYKKFFDDFELDLTKYISSGLIIFNESHKSFFDSFKKLYYNKTDELVELQDKLVKKGTEQTPLNYWLQINNIDIKTDLPLSWKFTHMHRKELYGYNWQLNNSKTPYFIKYGNVWNFSGFAKDKRTEIMSNVWNMVGHNYTPSPLEYAIDTVNHKNTYKNSTSRKFKIDLFEYLKDKSINNVIEFGCCQGDTTKILSLISDKVYASDISPENIEIAKDKCIGCENVLFEVKDINTEWEYPLPSLVYLDALHDYNGITNGLNRVKSTYPNSIIVMDDYGHEMNTVKPIIDNLLKNKEIKVLSWIGEDKDFVAANGKKFVDKEGLIFKFQL
jgi:hypothetical protein